MLQGIWQVRLERQVMSITLLRFKCKQLLCPSLLCAHAWIGLSSEESESDPAQGLLLSRRRIAANLSGQKRAPSTNRPRGL